MTHFAGKIEWAGKIFWSVFMLNQHKKVSKKNLFMVIILLVLTFVRYELVYWKIRTGNDIFFTF